MGKKLIWILVTATGILFADKVSADCHYMNMLPNKKCYTWNPDVANNCGSGCTYTYEDGTVYITANGNNARITGERFTRYSYEGNVAPVAFTNFVIDGAIRIGENTFTGASNYTISGANGELVITGVDHHGFGDQATLTGNIVIPANATFSSLAFHGVTLADDAKIYCAVENCAEKLLKSCNYSAAIDYQNRCINAVNTVINDENKFEQAPEGCTFWSAKGCSKCSNSNFELDYGYCYRKRYTMPEADKATNDDDENMIEWTFM